jgi:hypothetical protein
VCASSAAATRCSIATRSELGSACSALLAARARTAMSLHPLLWLLLLVPLAVEAAATAAWVSNRVPTTSPAEEATTWRELEVMIDAMVGSKDRDRSPVKAQALCRVPQTSHKECQATAPVVGQRVRFCTTPWLLQQRALQHYETNCWPSCAGSCVHECVANNIQINSPTIMSYLRGLSAPPSSPWHLPALQ